MQKNKSGGGERKIKRERFTYVFEQNSSSGISAKA
jgi:hypothetical protein